MHLLDKISSAITYTLFEQLQAEVSAHNGNVRECAAFVLGQVRRMPDYLWPPFYLLAVCLTLISLGTGGCFHTIAPEKRMLLLRRWQRLPGPCKDFFLFYHTLVSFYLFSAMDLEKAQ